MTTKPKPRRVARILNWDFPDGTTAAVQLRQVAVKEWLTHPAYRTGDWHCVPAREPGQVLLARMTRRKADIVRV
jgi:hypothetical protein